MPTMNGHSRPKALYRELLGRGHGALTRQEEAYARFQLSWVRWYQGVDANDTRAREEAIGILRPFAEQPALRRAQVAPRALFSLANMLRVSPNLNRRAEAKDILRRLAREHRAHPNAQRALWLLATSADSPRESAGYLQRLLRDYPDTTFRRLAEQRLAQGGEST